MSLQVDYIIAMHNTLVLIITSTLVDLSKTG